MSTIKKIITLTLVLVLLITAIAISSLNAENAALNLYWYQLNWPLGFTLLLFSCLGVILGLLLGWLFWTWPANRKKMYWKRNYFQLKQEHDKAAESKKNSTEPVLVNDQVNNQ